MSGESVPVSKDEEVLEVVSEVEKNTKTETSKGGIQPKRDSKRSSLTKLTKFSVVLLHLMALVIGSFAGSYTFFTVTQMQIQNGGETSAMIAELDDLKTKMENDTNLKTAACLGLMRNVSELQNLQIKTQAAQHLDNEDLSQLKLNVSDLKTTVMKNGGEMSAMIAEMDDLKTKINEDRTLIDSLTSELQRLQSFCNSSGSIKLGKTCYKFYADNKTFYDAKATCDLASGMLAIIDREDIHNELSQIGAQFWIGMEDITVIQQNRNIVDCNSKVRIWLNGRYVTFQRWTKGNPSCETWRRPENCVESVRLEGWNDRECNATLNFICQFIDPWS